MFLLSLKKFRPKFAAPDRMNRYIVLFCCFNTQIINNNYTCMSYQLKMLMMRTEEISCDIVEVCDNFALLFPVLLFFSFLYALL